MIKSIEMKIGKKTLKLTKAQARELHAELDDLFGTEYPAPITIYRERPYWWWNNTTTAQPILCADVSDNTMVRQVEYTNAA